MVLGQTRLCACLLSFLSGLDVNYLLFYPSGGESQRRVFSETRECSAFRAIPEEGLPDRLQFLPPCESHSC